MEKMNIFLEKTKSSFPVAIGTGLALESMFDPVIERYDKEREIPSRVDLTKYKYHIWNIYTIVRNLVNSINVKDKTEVYRNIYFVESVLEEIENIFLLYRSTKITPIIYMPKYDKISKALNINKDFNVTQSMNDLTNIINVVGSTKLKNELNIFSNVIKDCEFIPSMDGNILLTTHVNADLLQHKNAIPNKITLLESHTGKERVKSLQGGRYRQIGDKPMDIFPFTPELLYVFGDDNMVYPLPLTLRREVYNTAFKVKWTGNTSREKVITDLRKIPSMTDIIEKFRKQLLI